MFQDIVLIGKLGVKQHPQIQKSHMLLSSVTTFRVDDRLTSHWANVVPDFMPGKQVPLPEPLGEVQQLSRKDFRRYVNVFPAGPRRVQLRLNLGVAHTRYYFAE